MRIHRPNPGSKFLTKISETFPPGSLIFFYHSFLLSIDYRKHEEINRKNEHNSDDNGVKNDSRDKSHEHVISFLNSFHKQIIAEFC